LPQFLAFSIYGAFWLAYAAFLHPSFGVSTAYAHHPGQLANATGIFLAAWFILSAIFL
jgi:succinate-acetate transporter protein